MRVANAVSNSSSSRKAKFKKSCLDRYFKMNSDEICSGVFFSSRKKRTTMKYRQASKKGGVGEFLEKVTIQ